jgi:hypothetical protein
VFKPLSPTPISGSSLVAFFGSRSFRFVCTVIVVLLGFVASASVATGQTSDGDSVQAQATPIVSATPEQRLVRIVPYGRGTSASPVKNTLAAAGSHLTYFGGPVISNVHVVIVFWGTNVDPVVTAPGTIDQFFADITNSRYYDLLTEYSTVGVTGAGPSATSSNQTIGRGQFDATVTIIPSSCPGPTSCTLTDTQIQTELTNQLAAGHLPAPVKDAQGIIETFYMIYFPPGVHINLGTAPSCATGGFCAYHSNTSNLVPYGVLPDFGPTSGCQAPHCGNGTEFQNITAVTSHEMSEAVTDAQVGTAQAFDAPLAWYDHVPPPASDPGEIGDICGGQDTTVSAGAHTYTVQTEFSNLQNDCVSAPPVLNLSAPGQAAPGSAFSALLSVQSSVNNSVLAGYTGTVHFTSSDAGAILPADYTFVAADAGSHSFSFTLNGFGNQTITATDTHSRGFVGSATITPLGPDLTPTILILTPGAPPLVNQGTTGAALIVRIANVGNATESGTLTVVATLPAGLTATSMGGGGWTCTVATLTCTQTGALGAGIVDSDINITVSTPLNAPVGLFSVGATVSTTDNDVNPANNTSSAPINIAPVIFLSTTTPNETVTAGQQTQFEVDVRAGNQAGLITFSCSGLPAASTCSFSTPSLNSVSLNNVPISVFMNIVTTSRASVFSGPHPDNRNPWLWLELLSLAAMAALAVKLHNQTSRRPRLVPILVTCGLLIVGIFAGCGGGGSTPPPPPPPPPHGTPAGTFVVTFTATSPNGTTSKAMNLTVN